MIPALGALAGIVLGQPLFIIFGLVAVLCFVATGDGVESVRALLPMVERIRELADKDVLLAIPFFVVSGAIMARGKIAERLIDVARALVGWLPGGLAVAAVLGCMFFAAISGSSPATVIAIGTLMFPAMMAQGYRENFSLGLVTTAGSLGILIPPSIPMVVYAIAKTGGDKIDIAELFLAGIGPGLFIGGLLMIYAIVSGKRMNVPRQAFSVRAVFVAIRDGFWSLMLPGIILGGIYGGFFTPTEAAGISVAYAFVVEVWIHRAMKVEEFPAVLADSAVLMGSLLVIMVLAMAFNDWMVDREIPERATAWVRGMNLGPVGFLLVVNAVLFVAGCLMDIMSAILLLVPLLSPIAEALGIDPIHLAIVFIVNLELGYMTPPVGLNLFVSSSIFRKPIGQVIRAVVPTAAIMLFALIVISYVPTIPLGLVRALRGQPIYAAFPSGGRAPAAAHVPSDGLMQPGGAEAAPASPSGGGQIKSLQEMMNAADDDGDDDDGDAPAPAPPKPQ